MYQSKQEYTLGPKLGLCDTNIGMHVFIKFLTTGEVLCAKGFWRPEQW